MQYVDTTVDPIFTQELPRSIHAGYLDLDTHFGFSSKLMDPQEIRTWNIVTESDTHMSTFGVIICRHAWKRSGYSVCINFQLCSVSSFVFW